MHREATKDRLSRLDLSSLEMRRLRCDLLYTYKIVFNLVSEAANDMFTLSSTLSSIKTRGHPYKLYLHNSRIDVRKYFFIESVIIPWNNLPAIPEHFSSFSSFKRFINYVDLTQDVSL